MRTTYGGVAHVAAVIEEDLQDRDTGLSKPHRIGLADLAASIMASRSVNTSEIANILPREVKSDEERYRYINRWLGNEKIDPLRAMKGFVPEMMEALSEKGETVILMLDQSKISEGFECLMISARVHERAVAVGWRVVETKGEIGFEIQKQLIEEIGKMIPEGIDVMLAADRFYGTSSLISLCQKMKWKYRVRLKGNMILNHKGGELKTGELLKLGLKSVEEAELNQTGVMTNIGVLQEERHPEPWIIAMGCKPTEGRVLDYGMRWGIEALFSDMKTRGFGVTKTKLKDAKRIERLLLVLTVACYWAVSTGMQPKAKSQPSKKKRKGASSHTSREA